jgi:hypothetical protein
MKHTALGVVVALLLLPGCKKPMAGQPKPAQANPPAEDAAGAFYAETAAVAKKVNDASTDFLKRLG